MADERWLEEAPTITDGVYQCAAKLVAWADYSWDERKSDRANADAIGELHTDFFRSFDRIVKDLNDWRDLPHPPITGVRKASRQWVVLSSTFSFLVAAIGYEYTASSLRFGDDAEVKIGDAAAGKGARQFSLMRQVVDQAISGRVTDFDDTLKWSHYLIDDRKALEEFESKYADRAAALRHAAGMSHRI